MKKNYIILLVVLALAAAVGLGWYVYKKTSRYVPPVVVQKDPREEISGIVKSFGEKLKLVPLSAPKADVVRAIEENYGPFVSVDLLNAWKEDPIKAPGRLTSSPWPDRIEVLEVELQDDGAYDVQGAVIEVTSVEGAGGAAASHYSVAMKFRKQNDKWVMTGFVKEIPI